MTGWITRTGELIECESYEHFKVDDPTIKSIWEEYQDILNDIENDIESLEEGEHPEWHTYENAEYSCQREAIDKLYKLGYLRIFKYGIDVGVEGLGQWIENHKYSLKKITNKMSCELKFFKK